ncbi:hypothetical protein VPH35_085447 [Triticum aestivum]
MRSSLRRALAAVPRLPQQSASATYFSSAASTSDPCAPGLSVAAPPCSGLLRLPHGRDFAPTSSFPPRTHARDRAACSSAPTGRAAAHLYRVRRPADSGLVRLRPASSSARLRLLPRGPGRCAVRLHGLGHRRLHAIRPPLRPFISASPACRACGRFEPPLRGHAAGKPSFAAHSAQSRHTPGPGAGFSESRVGFGWPPRAQPRPASGRLLPRLPASAHQAAVVPPAGSASPPRPADSCSTRPPGHRRPLLRLCPAPPRSLPHAGSSIPAGRQPAPSACAGSFAAPPCAAARACRLAPLRPPLQAATMAR